MNKRDELLRRAFMTGYISGHNNCFIQFEHALRDQITYSDEKLREEFRTFLGVVDCEEELDENG